MANRETPFRGDIYFYLNDNDEEKLDVWDSTPKDYERERKGVVFNTRNQLKMYVAGKLCPECDGYSVVQAYDAAIEPHLPPTPAGTEPCHCQKTTRDH